jgi:drug/metabolite transporter (DMT)-like permease
MTPYVILVLILCVLRAESFNAPQLKVNHRINLGLSSIKPDNDLIGIERIDTVKIASKSIDAVKEEAAPNALFESDAFWKSMVLVITVLWATNFPVIKEIYSSVPGLSPPVYSAVRFSFASLFLAPFALKQIKNTELALSSMAIGSIIALGYVGQGVGIELSTADKAAFLCSTQVVWVALVNGFRFKKFNVQTWVSVALAIIGTGFIELLGYSAPNLGDAWLLLQPIGFGSGYILLEQVIRKYPDDALAITGFKLISVAFWMDLWAASTGCTWADVAPILDSPTAMACLFYTGAITTAGCIWLQSLSFKRVSAADASIIISSEPVWAILVGFVLLGEKLTQYELFGGFLIILAGLSYEFNLVDKLTGKKELSPL